MNGTIMRDTYNSANGRMQMRLLNNPVALKAYEKSQGFPLAFYLLTSRGEIKTALLSAETPHHGRATGQSSVGLKTP